MEPTWVQRNGVSRLVPEYRALSKALRAGTLGAQFKGLSLFNDDAFVWRLELHPPFDEDTIGGRQLNSDLAQLSRQGLGHILLELRCAASRPGLNPPRACSAPPAAVAGDSESAPPAVRCFTGSQLSTRTSPSCFAW